MREIKFRAWDERDKYMWTVGEMAWLVGGLHINDGGSTSGFIKDRFILMQYTGLKSKNGKEIYESDIIKATNKLQGFIMCVVWDDMDAGWRVNYYNGTKAVQDWLCMYNQVKVIGNIYENPELITNVQ